MFSPPSTSTKSTRPLRAKKGLVDTVCVALEIHAQLEEEIFYPALRAQRTPNFCERAFPSTTRCAG